MTRKTILNDAHRALGARMVDFGGWDMPLHYGSQVDEHHVVRTDAGMFDVSHMTVVDLRGARVREFLRGLVANSVDKLQKPGKALYTCMLNAQGGVIDDLIIYYMPSGAGSEDWFRLVVNAATRDKDLAWIGTQARAFDVEVSERPEFGMIAVQGPNARDKVLGLLRDEDRARIGKLGKFAAGEARTRDGIDVFIARTGYTGEDGFEVIVPEDRTVDFWNALLEAGVKPAGLGARDTLRLEMGYPLNGNDLSPTRTPIEAGLGFFVDLSKEFIGRDVLATQKESGPSHKLAAIQYLEKGAPPRAHYPVTTPDGTVIGELASGALSPSLMIGIGMAYLPVEHAKPGTLLNIDIRGRLTPAKVVKKPFYKPTKSSS